MSTTKYAIKRNGSKVSFNPSKIYNALTNAALDTYPECSTKDFSKDLRKMTEEITQIVADKYGEQVFIEDVQDIIEQELMTYDQIMAKNFITYRYRHALARDRYASLMKDVKKKLTAADVQNQNANVDEKSFGGRKGETNDLLMKRIALEDYMSETAKNNHLNNMIYTHDLGDYVVGSHNCLSIPFDDLFKNGFNTRQTDVRPPQSISSAFQLLAVVFQLQSLQQFGGVSATHLDWTMVPFVRKSFYKHYIDALAFIEDADLENGKEKAELLTKYQLPDYEVIDKFSIDDRKVYSCDKAYKYALKHTTKETAQAAESMLHNLNTLQSRSGNQLPFTSINFGTCTLPEGRLITQKIFEEALKGIGKLHRTSIFPCLIFQCMKGTNLKKGDPNYDLFKLAIKCTAKRLYPNYGNIDWSGNKGYDPNDPKTYASFMGCRTFNGSDINAEPGINPQTKDGRGNICPVTIIMPTLAMMAKEWYENTHESDIPTLFMQILDKKIEEAKDALIERFEWICSQGPDSAKFMYENNIMLGYKPEEGIKSALKHGTLAIGQLGLAETLQILIGKDQTTSEGMELAKKIEQLFKDRCAEYKQKYHLNFGVYMTPKNLRLGVA